MDRPAHLGKTVRSSVAVDLDAAIENLPASSCSFCMFWDSCGPVAGDSCIGRFPFSFPVFSPFAGHSGGDFVG